MTRTRDETDPAHDAGLTDPDTGRATRDIGRAARDMVAAAAPAAVTRRSGVIECLHHGVGAAVRTPATGGGTRAGTGAEAAIETPIETVATLGGADLVVLPRSALKLLHAVAFLEAGAGLEGELLAIVCASHSGEPEHLAVVRRLLARFGLTEDDLDNTPTLPLDEDASFAWRTAGGGPSSLRQNCSGNHAGMLAACVAAGWPVEGYTRADHPVQLAIAATTARLAGWVSPDVAVDGCGAPAFGTTVRGLATAYARIGGAAAGTNEALVRDAVVGHPWLLGGTGRRNTRLMRAYPGVAVKDGADGVIAAGWTDADGVGTGVAVKVLDGADRARGVLLAEGMRRAGLAVDPEGPGVLEQVQGHGHRVGEVVALPWA